MNDNWYSKSCIRKLFIALHSRSIQKELVHPSLHASRIYFSSFCSLASLTLHDTSKTPQGVQKAKDIQMNSGQAGARLYGHLFLATRLHEQTFPRPHHEEVSESDFVAHPILPERIRHRILLESDQIRLSYLCALRPRIQGKQGFHLRGLSSLATDRPLGSLLVSYCGWACRSRVLFEKACFQQVTSAMTFSERRTTTHHCGMLEWLRAARAARVAKIASVCLALTFVLLHLKIICLLTALRQQNGDLLDFVADAHSGRCVEHRMKDGSGNC